MDKMYSDVKNLLECEIDEISKKKEMSESDLDALDKLIDILKDIYEIEGMESGATGYSGRINYMPYYGAIGYDEASFNRDSRSSYGRSGRNYNNNGRSSYGRNMDDEMRMMPDRNGRMDW